jgi:hypothetical protein
MIYRKRGSTIRWENGVRIRVSESGWAREVGNLFECAPLDEALPQFALDEESPRLPALPSSVEVERFVYSRGIASHEYGDARWTESSERAHVALVRGSLRVLLDCTGDQLGELARIAQALALASPVEEEAPRRLRLAPNVTAALLPVLYGIAPPNVRLVQTAGATDGYGQHVTEEGLHYYRPSYRVRPEILPFDLRLVCDVTEIEADQPIAEALLEPATSHELAVLVREGARAYPARIRVTRIDAVSDQRVWYPYGAGSFGAEMML